MAATIQQLPRLPWCKSRVLMPSTNRRGSLQISWKAIKTDSGFNNHFTSYICVCLSNGRPIFALLVAPPPSEVKYLALQLLNAAAGLLAGRQAGLPVVWRRVNSPRRGLNLFLINNNEGQTVTEQRQRGPAVV